MPTLSCALSFLSFVLTCYFDLLARCVHIMNFIYYTLIITLSYSLQRVKHAQENRLNGILLELVVLRKLK